MKYILFISDSILNARNHFDSKDFPILVSQDCGHQATKEMILKYKGNHEDFEFIQQPDLSNPPVKSSAVGYYKLRNITIKLVKIIMILSRIVVYNN